VLGAAGNGWRPGWADRGSARLLDPDLCRVRIRPAHGSAHQ
jgi:hypothetical protein